MMRILALGLTLTAAPLAIADSLPAQTLLERMTEATQELDYQGRFLYQLGGEVSTMEIRHAVIDGEQYQRFTHLDGRQGVARSTGTPRARSHRCVEKRGRRENR